MDGILIALVTVLPVMTSLCTLATFFIARNKDHHKDGEKWGKIQADLSHIKDAMSRTDENLRGLQPIIERLIKVEESVKAAHKRIDEMTNANRQED